MDQTLEIGGQPLRIEQVVEASASAGGLRLTPAARERIRRGRERLLKLLDDGARIYAVNTGVGGNIRFHLNPEEAAQLQGNLLRHLLCGTGDPLPEPLVRAAMILRVATFARGSSGVREELVDGLIGLFGAGIVPVVPRYGSVGASGDLIPSAYIGRTLLGWGEVFYRGARVPAADALAQAGLAPLTFAPKEAVALVNGTTVMTAAAAHLWMEAWRVLRGMLAAVALAVEAMEAPADPYEPWVQAVKGHPGQEAAAAFVRGLIAGSGYVTASPMQTAYSLRCPPQGLGVVWESLETARPVIEREINSANDNPLIDPDTGRLYQAGNFYGGHIARWLDVCKLDLTMIANWGNALMALLVDDRFNRGLPPNLAPRPGLNSGFKGLQLSATSLTCAVRQLAGASAIHSLPTEQYNQDVVSLGMHAAVSALDALRCARDLTAIVLIAAAQAVDLRSGPEKLGQGSRRVYETVRTHAPFLEADQPLEEEVASLSRRLAAEGVA
jgi:phenylalanine ammonia-lyase